MDLRKRAWEILEIAEAGDLASRAFDIGILSLIFANVIAVIVGSVQVVEQEYGGLLNIFEIVSVLIFTAEFVARLWSCTADSRFSDPIFGRLRFILQPLTIIDLLAILPFYLPFLAMDLRSIRILRLFRIVRIAKIGRYYSSLNLLRHVFQSRKEELILTSVLMVFVLVMASTVLYYCENNAQPDKFSSIPATMWWSVSTLTTVGYGDVYPVTTIGKFCASLIAILGIGMFALPTGILGAGFVEAVQKRKNSHIVCPHCGKEIY